jgi:hypothetical protein
MRAMNLATLLSLIQDRMLRGWKEIQAWFEEQGFPKDGGPSIRTLQRWEIDRGMPVFRIGHRVYSHPKYILEWLFQYQERGAFYGRNVDNKIKLYYRQELKTIREAESYVTEPEPDSSTGSQLKPRDARPQPSLQDCQNLDPDLAY